jgi:hypothetical protein
MNGANKKKDNSDKTLSMIRLHPAETMLPKQGNSSVNIVPSA